MPLLGLTHRLSEQPQPSVDFAYHVTHGVRIHSIKLTGLVTGKPGVQYKTDSVFFATNLDKTYSSYGTTIVSPMERKFGKCAFAYYQGVAVLRAKKDKLTELGFSQVNENDWAGSNVPSSDLELFIDGTWQSLESVKLGFANTCWRVLYDATPRLRSYCQS